MKRVLLDHGVPAALRHHLEGDVVTAFRMGWSELSNGELIAAAETAGFDVLVTCDQNIRYQQNLARRRIAVVVLRTTAWPLIAKETAAISAVISEIETRGYRELLGRTGQHPTSE